MKCGCSIDCFLNSENLIRRGMDISKYFRESLRLRDNKSRLSVEKATIIDYNPSKAPDKVFFFFS